ncbi:hypothetical protein ANCCAN_24082 [Ancylostoma caninum]|uniref:Phosphoenolpyruvate carboxykinase GTP-utilising N-terminal domain-containing protein n=1 Tax=Ancylostoma caninum TaxID=29170 RepID=A0A368FH04_ANCCA|nr:hypothetical protein ANCCAN_24082 [Ancylostoma caninum]
MPVPSTCKTDFVIEGYGTVPILNGDPKWLPPKVKGFVGTQVKLMRPAAVHICNGSFSEAEQLTNILEKKGVLEKLEAFDNVFVARTDPSDAMEKPIFICTKNRIDVEARYIGSGALGFFVLEKQEAFFLHLLQRNF